MNIFTHKLTTEIKMEEMKDEEVMEEEEKRASPVLEEEYELVFSELKEEKRATSAPEASHDEAASIEPNTEPATDTAVRSVKCNCKLPPLWSNFVFI